MKKYLIISIVVLMNTIVSFAQDWHTNINQAKEIAAQENKAIVLVFQGSDWCAPCIKLDKEIWRSDAFKKYAAQHFVMLQADFPRRKKNALSDEQVKANAALAEKYNQSGIFPLVVVLDHQGNVLGETGYKKTTPNDYISELSSFIN